MSSQEERWWFLCSQFLDISLSKEVKRAILREMKDLVVFV